MLSQAEEILSHRGAAGARALFSADPEEARARFRNLAAQWHPDHCDDPKAGEVFRHLIKLREQLKVGARPGPEGVTGEEVILTARTGLRFRTRPLYRHQSDIGEILVGARTVSNLVPPENADLAALEVAAVCGFRFADDRMRAQMADGLPELMEERPLEGGGTLLIYRKDPGEMLLADLLRRDGPLPPEHAAWVCSGLLNVAAWLGWAGMWHGGISADTVAVNTDTHSVRLVGGWAFSGKAGDRATAFPNRTLHLMPFLAVKTRLPDEGVTLGLIRRTVLEALGDPNESRLDTIGVPDPVGRFLRLPPARTGAEDYASWQSALRDGWGGRKFVIYPVPAA